MKRWLFFLAAVAVLAFATASFVPRVLSETDNRLTFVFFIASLVLAFSAFYVMLHHRDRQKARLLQNRLSMWTTLSYHVNQVGDEVFNELPIGIIAYDENHEVKWANPHARHIFDSKMNGKDLKDIHSDLHRIALAGSSKETITYKKASYDVIHRPGYRFFYLFDATERARVKAAYDARVPVLAILNLDNLEDTLATLDVSEQSSLKGEYLSAISDWAAKHDSYLKPYGEERSVMMTVREKLKDMIETKFEILDTIRQISQRNQVRVSLSIGIASWDVSYEDLGLYAQNAVELAEKRGGDQVVVNIQDQKIAYFGGKNDATAKSSKIGARVNAHTIRDHVEKASSVLIMGHKDADLDAIGAAIGVWHMANISKKTARIIIDPDKVDRTIQMLFETKKTEIGALQDRFVTSADALGKIDAETLLFVVDTQSPKVVMSPDILERAKNLIVIDHHRIGEESFEALFSYIEPYASSTVELVMELLNFYDNDESVRMSSFEANLMYGGLVLDTSNFTFRTGSRTFEVASKLREHGADPTETKMWLRRDLRRTMTINRFLQKIEIVLDRFALIVSNDIIPDRIMLAQIAEEALKIGGIDAAFAIAKTDEETVAVSARSFREVNVQMMMETLGGGGHLNSAAAQITQSSIRSVTKKIKTYLDAEYGQGGEPMKVILTEDVKGRGKKDDIIEVANGYGQFLVTQKKAVMATEENVAMINRMKAEEDKKAKEHLELMKKLKSEIDNRQITLQIQIGQDGKLFGSVTTKQICEAFEREHGIVLDRKKVDVDAEINSVGIYTATVTLHRDIKAQFEIHITEK